MPAAQLAHCAADDAPAGQLEPAAQEAHVVALDPVLYEPAGQGLQAVPPIAKVPGVHAVHGPPSRPSKSSRHRHLDLLELPCGEILYAAQSLHDDSAVARVASEYLPLAHRSHLSEPGADEKDPGAHGVHGPPLGPKNPLAHRQSVSPLLPQGDTELRGHSRHALAEIAPSSVEKKSSGHCVQDSVPASFL